MGRGEYTERLEVLNFFFIYDLFQIKKEGEVNFVFFLSPLGRGGGVLGQGTKKIVNS